MTLAEIRRYFEAQAAALARGVALCRELQDVIAAVGVAPASVVTKPKTAKPEAAKTRRPLSVATPRVRPSDELVFKALASAGEPITLAACAHRARVTNYAAHQALARLAKSKRVIRTGKTSTCRWQVVSPSRHAQAAPVSKTVSANGVEFDRVWNGQEGLSSVGRDS